MDGLVAFPNGGAPSPLLPLAPSVPAGINSRGDVRGWSPQLRSSLARARRVCGEGFAASEGAGGGWSFVERRGSRVWVVAELLV